MYNYIVVIRLDYLLFYALLHRDYKWKVEKARYINIIQLSDIKYYKMRYFCNATVNAT